MANLKVFSIRLDVEKVDAVKKSGQDLGSFLRTCMEEKTVGSTEGVRVEESEVSKNSKSIKALEAKILKMDVEFKDARTKYEHSYRQMRRAMDAQGLTP